MLCAHNGKMSVINRRKLTSVNYEAFGVDEVPKFTLMDAFNLTEYEANGFRETGTEDKSLNAYYNAKTAPKTQLPRVEQQKEVFGNFSSVESGIVVCTQSKTNNIYVRNYVLHQVVKRITLDSPLLCFDLCSGKPQVLVALTNGKIKILDYTNENEATELSCDSYHAFQGIQFCSYNMIATIAGPEITTYAIINKN